MRYMTVTRQVNLYVAVAFPRWKEIVLEILRAAFNEETNECGDQVRHVTARYGV